MILHIYRKIIIMISDIILSEFGTSIFRITFAVFRSTCTTLFIRRLVKIYLRITFNIPSWGPVKNTLMRGGAGENLFTRAGGPVKKMHIRRGAGEKYWSLHEFQPRPPPLRY